MTKEDEKKIVEKPNLAAQVSALLTQARELAASDLSLEPITAEINSLLLRLNPSEVQKLITKWANIIKSSDKNGFVCPRGVSAWLVNIHTNQVNHQETKAAYNNSKLLRLISDMISSGYPPKVSRLLAVSGPNLHNVCEIYYGIPLSGGDGGRPARGSFLSLNLPTNEAIDLVKDVESVPELMERVIKELDISSYPAVGTKMYDTLHTERTTADLIIAKYPPLDYKGFSQTIYGLSPIDMGK